MKRTFSLVVLLVVIAALFVVPVNAQGVSRTYILVANGNSLPAKLEAKVVAAGGAIERLIPQIGLAVVSSSNPNFALKAAKILGIQSVLPDINAQWLDPNEDFVLDETYGNPPSSGDNDPLFDLQWGADAVDAPEAWNLGYRGAGVRVAVLDAGIDATHPDLAPNVNTGLSMSFVPGENWQVQPGSYFNHGTHVAGTIAAADNGIGVIGIAPLAELVAVKVLSEFTGSGAFDWVIQGIVYATDIDADIINMSLGAVLAKNGFIDDNGTPNDPTDDYKVGANEVAALRNALSRATTYAYQNGTTVIVSAGNDAIDRNHDAAITVLPADSDHVIQISATAPVGWAVDPSVFLDNLASYSNYGQSAIDFAAPGGDYMYLFVNPSQLCTVAGRTRPCYVFDYVMSDGAGGSYYWAVGTSMAAPHASGVAAIIIGKNGGDMKPAAVEAALRASADDLGKPGNDYAYGAGRVNAYNAVK